MNHPSPLPGTAITASFGSGGRLRHSLYIDSGDAETNTERYEALEAHKNAIEAAYGRPLTWEPMVEAQACQIADYAEGDVGDTEHHDTYVDWFFDADGRLRRALSETDLT